MDVGYTVLNHDACDTGFIVVPWGVWRGVWHIAVAVNIQRPVLEECPPVAICNVCNVYHNMKRPNRRAIVTDANRHVARFRGFVTLSRKQDAIRSNVTRCSVIETLLNDKPRVI